MEYTYDELRQRISLLEFALAHGYECDRRKGLKWPVLNHHSGDRIIIVNPRNPAAQGYFNPGDDGDRGTLIQFVRNRLGWLFPEAPERSQAWNVNRVLHEWLSLPFRDRRLHAKLSSPSRHGGKVDEVAFDPALLGPLEDPSWLLSRGITRETLNDILFEGRILQSRTGTHRNTAFPYRKELDGRIVGAEVRNHNFKGHMCGSLRGVSLWVSRCMPGSERIVVCESALDALSHFEMNGDGRDVYVSFGGHLAEGQLECLKGIYRRLSTDRHMRLDIGTDDDEKGHLYAAMLRREFPEAERILPQGKDFNDMLMKRKRAGTGMGF
jgi:hypothetical protein